MAETLESRLDYVESEVLAAGDISTRLDHAGQALRLIHGILEDLVVTAVKPEEYSDDLARIEELVRTL